MLSSAHGLQYQTEYFVVIDFQATCEKYMKLKPQEIIEFSSVIVSGWTGETEAAFQAYVQPEYHPILTNYCKKLTGIQQQKVDGSVTLNEALLLHDKWLENKAVKYSDFDLVTWGDWDCGEMLESECRLKGIRKPLYFNSWINLKVAYEEVFGFRCNNLKDAVQRAGLVWEGLRHSGLDDARNAARLVSLLMGSGFRFSITGSLVAPDGAPITGDGPGNGAYCLCGVGSSKCMIRKPGPNRGKWFFGCGNWTPGRGSVCSFFAWA